MLFFQELTSCFNWPGEGKTIRCVFFVYLAPVPKIYCFNLKKFVKKIGTTQVMGKNCRGYTPKSSSIIPPAGRGHYTHKNGIPSYSNVLSWMAVHLKSAVLAFLPHFLVKSPRAIKSSLLIMIFQCDDALLRNIKWSRERCHGK